MTTAVVELSGNAEPNTIVAIPAGRDLTDPVLPGMRQNWKDTIFHHVIERSKFQQMPVHEPPRPWQVLATNALLLNK